MRVLGEIRVFAAGEACRRSARSQFRVDGQPDVNEQREELEND